MRKKKGKKRGEREREDESKGNGNIATKSGLLYICLLLSSGYGEIRKTPNFSPKGNQVLEAVRMIRRANARSMHRLRKD